MADFDKQEFKFPDEAAKETKIEVSAEDDNIEIEIEDDTPEKDRNVDPLPENVKQELYEDELEDYSAKVKKKLLQMKKLAHDERREKEQALREHHEALALAQRVIEENKRLKNNVNENEKSILLSVTKAVELELEKAKEDYKKAYESGDTDKVIDAQQKLTELSMKQDKVRNFKPTPLQIEEPVVQMRQQEVQAPRPDPTAVSWQQQNTWFGEDDEMTSLALGLHEKLKKEGVAVSSNEYYRRIDETMRKRFPERFETDSNEQKNEETRSTRPSTVVAPATRSTSSKKIRLTTSQLSIAKKLGLTNEQYAQAVLKMES
jgi:hypothetical protein